MVMKPFTFSNGITLQPGEIVATPIAGIHMDDNLYEKAHEFDGFRFSRMRERDGDSAKLYSVNSSTEFLQFGHGKNVWYAHFGNALTPCSPGRFFAVNSLKLMLALMLLKYDIKTVNGERPANWEYQSRAIPQLHAKILFRRRA